MNEMHHNAAIHCNYETKEKQGTGKKASTELAEVRRRRKSGSGGGEVSSVPHSAVVS